MGKGLKVAIAVEAIVLVIAAGFTIAFFKMGGFRAGNIMNVLLVALWVLVGAALLLVFRQRSLLREEMIRRFYLSEFWIYNHEIGYAPIAQIVPDGDVYEFVTFAADSLAHMSYGFEVAETPDDFEPKLLISSNTFRFHLVGEGDDDTSAVIDQWKGTLQKVGRAADGTHTYTALGSYGNAKELARLIEDAISAEAPA